MINGRLSPEEGAVIEKAFKTFESQLEEEGFSAETLDDELATQILDELGEVAFDPTATETGDAKAVNARDEARERFFAGQSSHEYSRRRADALVALADAALKSESDARGNADRYQVMVHVDAAALVNDDLFGRSGLADGPLLPPETIRRLGCDCSIVSTIERDGEILSVGRKTRTIPTPIKRALRARDRHCRFPGCTSKVWVDGHHIEYWTHGGETKLSNLVLVCRAHHRALHEYGYSVKIEGTEIAFFRPDGSRIETPAPPTSNPAKVPALNRQRGLEIDAETVVPDWYGDEWDYSVTVDDLLRDHELV